MEPQTAAQKQLKTLLHTLKKTEKELLDSRESYMLAVQGAQDGLWDWNVLTNEVFYAPRFQEILGYQDGEFENQFSEFESRLHPDDCAQVLAAIRSHLERHIPYDIECRLRAKPGDYRWIHIRGQAQWDGADQAIRMAGSIRDITQYKQVEAQIYEMKQRLELATSSAHIGVWDLDLVTNQLIWDARMYELYGVNPAEFGGAYEAWQHGVHPDDLAAADQAVQAAVAGEKDFHTEFRVVWPDGQIRFIEAHATILRDDVGVPQRMIGVNWDITERKTFESALRASEARWQFALEGAGDGVWDWNPQTNEVFFSHQWKAMLGYEDYEISNTLEEWDSRVHPDDKEQCYADLNRHLSGQTPVYKNEHRVRCKDGSYKWILDRGKVIEWDQEGNPLRVVGTHADISDRKNRDYKGTDEDIRISSKKN